MVSMNVSSYIDRRMTDSSGMRAGLKGNVEEALRLFAAEAEWAGLNLAETEFVLEETLKCYGATFDGEMILELFKFYRRYLGMASVSRRQQLLTRMTEYISEGHQHRHIALLCFISADTDGQITSGAALDLAMVTPPDKGDPLTGPKFVAFHGCGGVRAKLGKPGSDDEGDVAAGLLLLGDMRLLPLLEEIWERLTPEGRRRMVQRRSNLVSALIIEFLLRRLEADKEEEYFGELGAALHNLPAIAAKQPINAVLDIRRNFGLPPGKEPMELLSHEDIPTAFARFRPRLQASFSLCVSSARISRQKSLERMAVVYQAAPKARQELDDLRDKKKRSDPWARADMAEAMRRIHTPQPEPVPLTPTEAAELAGVVLDPKQQRIEMANLLAAWEGATGFNPLPPVMTKNQFLEALVMLTTDMPNLFNHTGAFHPDDLTQDVPGGSPQKSAARPPEVTASKQPVAEEKQAEEAGRTPKYKGVLSFIYSFAMVEVLLCLIALFWALFCAEWWLLLALLIFAVLNFLRIGGLSARAAWTRWFAIGLYGLMLWYVGYRIQQHDLAGLPSGAAYLLLEVLFCWLAPMCFFNLICFDYAKQMREAPDEPA